LRVQTKLSSWLDLGERKKKQAKANEEVNEERKKVETGRLGIG
jgi:hypothetical protein